MALKSAGAELFFVSKLKLQAENYRYDLDSINVDHAYALKMLEKLDQMKMKDYLCLKKSIPNPWNHLIISALVQSAEKLGEFCETDLYSKTQVGGHVETCNEKNFFALIGLDTDYLMVPGKWKFLYPTHSRELSANGVSLMLKEYNKQNILDHFNFTFDQLQLLAVLCDKFSSSEEYENIMKYYFKRDRFRIDYKRVINFISNNAPANKFPLQNETVEAILHKIYGPIEGSNEILIRDFLESLDFSNKVYESPDRFPDEEIKLILQNAPFTAMATEILTFYPAKVYSYFLKVNVADMKNLHDLCIDFYKRVAGILLKNIEGDKTRKLFVRTGDKSLEMITYKAELPDFNVPALKQLLNGEMDHDQKYKMLSFLTDNLIEEKKMKSIPIERLMHIIIVSHLIKNNSMMPFEAIALSLALYKPVPSYMTYPEKVNVRAFRVSVLYQESYFILLNSFHAIGLKDFCVSLLLQFFKYLSFNHDSFLD
jgi:hypothetical protein